MAGAQVVEARFSVRLGLDGVDDPPAGTGTPCTGGPHDHIRETAGRGTAAGKNEADQLAKLSEVRSRGDITEAEFQRAKEKILH